MFIEYFSHYSMAEWASFYTIYILSPVIRKYSESSVAKITWDQKGNIEMSKWDHVWIKEK